jgi:branched-chain amino acid transport system ATP-binding protein
MTVALRTEGLSKSFGGLRVNSDITLLFETGRRYALIGPNGAGKTTFINLLTGALSPSAGDVFLGDRIMTNLPQHRRVKLGITRTFQINNLFAGLTVLESVLLAVCERKSLGGVWRTNVASQLVEVDEAYEILESLRLDRAADTLTRNLPYGEQRLLEIALALATKPKILVLDEPAAGIPVAHSRKMFEVFEKLPMDATIIFVEHDMELVFRFAERIIVLVDGRVLAQGPPKEIAVDTRVKQAYLGELDHG